MSDVTDPAAATPRLRTAASIVGVLWVLGVLLGLVWQWWSPAGPAGYVISPGRLQPDETEAFIAGDGRYAVLVVATGLAAGLVVWFARLERGPLAVLALTVGGLGGAVLTEFVGHWTSSGTASGRPNSVLAHLPLSLHMSGLRYVEAAAALLAYGLCVSFAVHDDLGRPDPVRERARASVGRDVQLQDAVGDGDGAGGAQQGDLPAQQHGRLP